MTTSPVPSITDDLLAELEEKGRTHYCHVQVSPATVLALVARIRELEKDAERLEWLLEQGAVVGHLAIRGQPDRYRVCWPLLEEWQTEWFPSEREAIDAAMSSPPKEEA